MSLERPASQTWLFRAPFQGPRKETMGSKILPDCPPGSRAKTTGLLMSWTLCPGGFFDLFLSSPPFVPLVLTWGIHPFSYVLGPELICITIWEKSIPITKSAWLFEKKIHVLKARRKKNIAYFPKYWIWSPGQETAPLKRNRSVPLPFLWLWQNTMTKNTWGRKGLTLAWSL